MLILHFVSQFVKRFIDQDRTMKKTLLKFLLVVAGIIWLYALQPVIIEDIENRLHDFRLSSRVGQAVDDRIVIVGIDQNSISELNRPYFAFAIEFARIANQAMESGAAGILFDLVLPPSSEKAIKDHVADVSAAIGLELPHRFYRQLGFDQAFRSSLLNLKASLTRLIIGFAYEKDQNFIADQAIMRIARQESTGFFNLPVDRDGRIRKALLRAKNPDGFVYSVGALGAQAVASASVDIDEYQIINFRGPSGTFRRIPLIKFLNLSDVQKAEMRNRLILVGFTDITDTKSTPVGFMPGVEVHANIIDNILNRRFLVKQEIFSELAIVLAIITVFLILGHFRPAAAAVISIFAAAGWAIFSLKSDGLTVLPVVKPAIILLLLALTEIYDFTRRVYLDRKRIRKVFGRYVSDSVLKEVLSAPEEDFISGRRRQLCILMADIRGFTSFSEKREAAEVVAFLNRYFTRMTDIIMKHGGVVDKFLGDGLLAFFNAPVEHKDFAWQAVQSALEIRKFSESAEFAEICGNTGLKIGVALNIGPVVFGNIGSEKKAEFTVIGDAVNTCSRMESLNKEFSTSIIVSEDVVKQCSSAVEWKLLGKKALRGKTEEISLYTVV